MCVLLESGNGSGGQQRTAARSIQNLQVWNKVFLTATCGQLGRNAEAAEVAAEVRTLDPEFSAEAWVYDPAVFTAGDAELKLYLDGVRKAGLPVCATEAYLQSHKDVRPLPDCQKVRVKS